MYVVTGRRGILSLFKFFLVNSQGTQGSVELRAINVHALWVKNPSRQSVWFFGPMLIRIGADPPCSPFLVRGRFVQGTGLTLFSLCWLSFSVFAVVLDTTVLWKEIIQRHGGVITDTLSVSCLAKITDGFTQGHIVQVVKEVLTERRIRQQPSKPLTALEFIASLTSMNPVYQEEEDSFKVNAAPVSSTKACHTQHLLPLPFMHLDSAISSEIWKCEIWGPQYLLALAIKYVSSKS